MQAPVSRCLSKEAGYPCSDVGSEGRSEPTEAPVEGQENLLDVYVRLALGKMVVIVELEVAVIAGIFEIGEPIFAAQRYRIGPLVFGTETHRNAIGIEAVTDLGERLIAIVAVEPEVVVSARSRVHGRGSARKWT